MRRAFVLQLGPATDPSRLQFDGRIEEVDTGRELRFRSTDELLSFLRDRFVRVDQENVSRHDDEPGAGGSCR